MFSVLSNAWISVIFYVVIAGIIIYFLYKSVRKKVTKSEIQQDKQSITKENTDRIEKNESEASVRTAVTDKYDKKNVS